jgi:CRP/FNR family transcriptional regulator, cyclic AMP receptor protein
VGVSESGAAAADFLTLLSSEDRQAFRSKAGVRRFRAGTTLMHEGQRGEEVLLLLEGRVKVICTTAEGKEIVLQFCGPGDLIGELSVVDDSPRSSTVEAFEPVKALALSGTDFRAFLASRPDAVTALLRAISRRFRDVDRNLIEFAASQTLGRVAGRLVELADRYGEPVDGGVEIDLRLSQEELAGWTGSSREAVAKALHSLRDLGLVVTERRRITVLDLDGLRRRAV